MNCKLIFHHLITYQANLMISTALTFKTVGFLVLSLLFSFSIAAQVEAPTNSYLKKSPLVKSCEQLDFNSVVPLKVKGVYRIFANVEKENSFTPDDIWLEDINGKNYEVTFDDSSNTFVSQAIPEGINVVLKYIDGCSNIVEGKSSSTEYNLGQIITVSNNMFALVANINALEKRGYNDILRLITENNTVDNFEKLSFIQQYLLKGHSLTSFKLDDINRHPSFEKMMDNCNCTVVTTYFTNTPGTHLQTIENDLSSRTITTNQTVAQSNELELNLRSSGPAKLWHIYSDGWKRTNGTWFGGATGAQVGIGSDGFPMVDPIVDTYLNDGFSLPSEFVQNTSIRMVLFCNNGVQTEECGCAKEIQPTAMYESEIGVRTQVLDGGGGTKRALAFGEDAAILYRQVLSGPNAGEFQLMGADIFQVSSSCNSDVNPQFFSSVLDVIGDVAQIALGFTGLTPDSTANISSQIENLLNSIDTLSSTQRRFITGDCVSSDEERRFEFPVEPFYLRPSEITQFALASRSRGLSMGMRSWQSEVLIKSDYRLAIFQPRGTSTIRTDDEEEKTQCCTDRASVAWIYGLIGSQDDVPTGNMNLSSDPISSDFDLRASLADELSAQSGENSIFLLEQGRRVVPYQWGQLVGDRDSKEGCKVLIDDEVPPVDIDPIGNIDGGKSYSSQAFEIKEKENLDCLHIVYSIDGKEVGRVNGQLKLTKSGEKIINIPLISDFLQKRKLVSGIYLVSSVEEHGEIILPTKKIVITR